MIDETCIPFASLPLYQTDDRPNYISSDFVFPGSVDTERLVVDLISLKRLQKLGSFGSTHLTRQTLQSDKRSFGTTHDPDGVDSSLLASQGYTQNIVHINRKIIQGNVEERQKWDSLVYGSDKSIEAYWASELSAACAESFRDSGRAHLLQRSTGHDTFLDTTTSGYNICGIAVDIATHNLSLNPLAHPFELIGSGLYAVLAMREALRVKRAQGGPLFKDKRWSLMPAFRQPDHYVALTTASLITSAVKAHP